MGMYCSSVNQRVVCSEEGSWTATDCLVRMSTTSSLGYVSRKGARVEGSMSSSFSVLLLLLSIILLINDTLGICDGEIIFKSGFNHQKSGHFSSPKWPDKYPQDIRCVYKFVAQENERVLIKFTNFNIEGLSKTCKKDFLDIYIQMKTPNDERLDSVLLGRYCGHSQHSVPNTLVSLYHVTVLDLFSDTNTQKSYNQDDHMGKLGFAGTYEFISAASYTPGPPLNTQSPGLCDFSIQSTDATEGIVKSPTYPGLYPDKLNCTYVFKGKNGQRVRVVFEDFDLYFIKNACPVDYISLYDGPSRFNHPIGKRFCNGTAMRFYSTGPYLTLVFISGEGRLATGYLQDKDSNEAEIQRKGFKIRYVFSEDFVQISEKQKRTHVRGTECDVWIKSKSTQADAEKGKTTGYITSPGFPLSRLPPNRLCSYYLYGIHTRHQMEKVVLNFKSLNLPSSGDRGCTSGYLAVYFVKIKIDKTSNTERLITVQPQPHRVLCGKQRNITVSSPNPVLILRLNTSYAPPQGVVGFEAKYSFEIDFGITGEMVSPGICYFIYKSQTATSGSINSPFYDRPYPSNSSCFYKFVTNGDEYVRINFHAFHTAELVSDTLYKSPHEVLLACNRDYLEVSEMVPDRTTGSIREHKLARYCGIALPGPIMTNYRSTALMLHFASDATRSTTGFNATFEFLKKTDIFTECGGNVSSGEHGGSFSSPRYPRNHPPNLTCEWYIYPSRHSNKIMLLLYDFVVEGSFRRSCSDAMVRIYDDDKINPTWELCGTDSAIPAYIANGTFVRVRFIAGKNSKGSKGFKIAWTEILPRKENGRCPGFECKKTHYCIDRKLECNGLPNCGTYTDKNNGFLRDNSDEILSYNCSSNITGYKMSEGPVTASYNLLHVGLGIVLTILFLIVIVVCILYREHKRTTKKHTDPLNEIHARKQLMTTVDGVDPVFHLTPTYAHPYIPQQARNGASGPPSVTGTLVREKMQKISIV